jgi:prepilin-type N-terminal cleavage/methylation domain-containing protein
MQYRAAFTLIEVLISIALMGLILPALYSSVDLLRDSNSHLFDYLQKSKKEIRATQTLYLDIASSDGNLTLSNSEFDGICMESTKNSLYELASAKVCWLVLKREHTLIRVEGSDYQIPLNEEERVEVDSVMEKIELFDIYWSKDKVIVILQQKGQKPVTFMVQGITKPKPKKKKSKQNKKGKVKPSNDTNTSKPPANTPESSKK